MTASDPTTRRRAARMLASLFWRGRSRSVRDALQPFTQGPAFSQGPTFPQKALDRISLLSPPPTSSSSDRVTALTPLLDTLATQLQTPATARSGSELLLDTFHVLLTTFLCRKGDVHAGLAGSTHATAQHTFVASSTLSSTVAWLQKLPDVTVKVPAMLAIVCKMLDLLTVPVEDSSREDNVPQASGMLQTMSNSARGPPSPPEVANDLLSPISHFLQGTRYASRFLCLRPQQRIAPHPPSLTSLE
jgi:hypothetical protein